MKSLLISSLLVCILVIDQTFSQWSVSGGLSANNGGWKAEVKVTFKWGRRKQRSVKLQIFDVVMYMVNNRSESSIRLNPCDYALYDQDGDLEVTMTDFDIIFDHNVENKHQLIERMFEELDEDKGVYTQYLINEKEQCDERLSDVFSKLKSLETKIDLYREENMALKEEIEKLSTCLNKTEDCAPFDCWDILQNGFNRTGIYQIYPWGSKEKSVKVHCNMDVAPGGWTMVHVRKGLTVNFTRGWEDYKNGFGTNAEFWLGNEIVHRLTNRYPNQLYIGISNINGSYWYQKYHSFRVGSESDKYRLHINGPTRGDAGDYILQYNDTRSIKNQRFTTFDNDNDNHAGNCATGTGGWWYNSCHYIALNNDPASPETVYQNRIPNMRYFRTSDMMINRVQ